MQVAIGYKLMNKIIYSVIKVRNKYRYNFMRYVQL